MEHSSNQTTMETVPPPSMTVTDAEKQNVEQAIVPDKVSAFKGLGWLDRFLAVWILLAMIVGVLLGNFVPNTGPALQKGKFVGVSIPIGETTDPFPTCCITESGHSYRFARYDVPDLV